MVPGLLGGLWGLWRSLGRLRKTSGELAQQVSTSPHGASSLFSAHERIVLGAPIIGILFSVGALYATFLILQNAPLMYIVRNLSMLGRLGGRYWWEALDKGGCRRCMQRDAAFLPQLSDPYHPSVYAQRQSCQLLPYASVKESLRFLLRTYVRRDVTCPIRPVRTYAANHRRSCLYQVLPLPRFP